MVTAQASLRGAFSATKQSQSVTEIASQSALAMTNWLSSYDQAAIYFAALSVKNFVFRRVSILAIDRAQGLLGRDVLNLLVANLNGPKLQFDLTTK